jgi:hypothetical protein
MTFWDFANQHWLVALLMVWCVAYAATTPFRLYFRSRNIRAAGWPPAYLDADGDRHDPKAGMTVTETVEASVDTRHRPHLRGRA